MKTETYSVELTDTFGGEANYSWVHRVEITVPEHSSNRLIVRRAKKALDVIARHITSDMGDELWLNFPGHCIVMFITLNEI